MTRWAVLGGGALGLTAALRLSQRGHSVTVIEREPLPGGLAAGFEIEPGIWLEKFYHHLFRSDTTAVRLITEMGLGDRLEWHRPVTATLRDGVFHQLDSPSQPPPLRPAPPARPGADGSRPRHAEGDAKREAARGPDGSNPGSAAGWATRPTASCGALS